MNKQETTQIITLLAGNYESIASKSQVQKQMMLNTWYECLNDLDYELVLQTIKKSIMENPYPPTIYDIRKNAIELSNPMTLNPMENNPLRDWNECYNMICNGTYMTQEEFNKHSEICKQFLGSLSQLRAYATNTEFNLDVVRSNFLKQHEILSKRQKDFNLLPPKMKELIGEFTEKIDMKQLTD